MVSLRVPVQCFRCRTLADKSQVLESKSVSGDLRFECYDCYKRKRTPLLAVESEAKKKGHYCERCRYKFTARNSICPYCSKDDQVITGKVTVEDLL
ncbi:MAG: hypothetical protein Q8Q01_03760 [archaeon]|nr:hypothetical protein [archaeon]